MPRTVVITGAASGIGAALSRQLADRGDRIIGVDLAGTDVSADLSTPEGRAAAIEKVADLAGSSLDAVVTCAGTSVPGKAMITVNFFGTTVFVDGLRDLLAASDAPRVILVGSALALGDYILEPLRQTFSRALPQSLSNVAEIVVDNVADELWARGAAAVALGELYGSPWGTTGPARRLGVSDPFSNKAE